jgi:hypothetical protein
MVYGTFHTWEVSQHRNKTAHSQITQQARAPAQPDPLRIRTAYPETHLCSQIAPTSPSSVHNHKRIHQVLSYSIIAPTSPPLCIHNRDRNRFHDHHTLTQHQDLLGLVIPPCLLPILPLRSSTTASFLSSDIVQGQHALTPLHSPNFKHFHTHPHQGIAPIAPPSCAS